MTYYTRLASVAATQIAAVHRVSDTGVWEVWDYPNKKWRVCGPDLADNRRRDVAMGDLLMTRFPRR